MGLVGIPLYFRAHMGTPQTSRHGPRLEALKGGILNGVDPGLWNLHCIPYKEDACWAGQGVHERDGWVWEIDTRGFRLGLSMFCIS